MSKTITGRKPWPLTCATHDPLRYIVYGIPNADLLDAQSQANKSAPHIGKAAQSRQTTWPGVSFSSSMLRELLYDIALTEFSNSNSHRPFVQYSVGNLPYCCGAAEFYGINMTRSAPASVFRYLATKTYDHGVYLLLDAHRNQQNYRATEKRLHFFRRLASMAQATNGAVEVVTTDVVARNPNSSNFLSPALWLKQGPHQRLRQLLVESLNKELMEVSKKYAPVKPARNWALKKCLINSG